MEYKQFYDQFFVKSVEFPAEQVNTTVNFFLKRGFDLDTSRAIAIVFLNQSRIDNVNVFDVLENLEPMSDAKLNQLLTHILNVYRDKTSLLGYRVIPTEYQFQTRNIVV